MYPLESGLQRVFVWGKIGEKEAEMKLSKISLILFVFTLFIFSGKTGLAEEELEDEEQSVFSFDVPQVVIEAAENAVEGITISEISVEREGGMLVYEAKGNVDSECYEIEVSPTGEVLEIETCD